MLGLGSNTQLGIGIAVGLDDRFSSKAKQLNTELVAMRKNASSAINGAIRDYRNQAATIAAGAAAISYGMYNAAQEGAKFQHSINQIAIVGGKELGRSRKELSSFARDLSKEFTRTPQDIAGAMFENVKAGLSSGMENITRYQIAVSTATDEALEGIQGVAFGLISIMNAMDIPNTQFARISNAVTAAANASQASVLSLNESMQYFANTAKTVNIPLEETLALVAKLSQSGIRGSSAGTALSNMIQHLVNAVGPFGSKKTKKAFALLGLDPNDLKGMMDQGKIFDIISMVDKASARLGTTDKLSALNAIFGVRGEKALINAFGNADPTKTLEALRNQITQGVKDDISMKQARAMQNDLYSDMKFLSNAFHDFKIAFTQAAAPTLRVMLGVLTKVVKVFGYIADTPIGKVLIGVMTVMTPIIGILFAFRAALLTATLAIRTLTMSTGTTGFAGLVNGGLGMIGGIGMSKHGITRNVNGKLMVAAGRTVNYGGKIYKGGQLLPSSISSGLGSNLAGLLGGGISAAAGGWGSKITGILGKSLPWLGRIGGFALRWVPVVGWIWTAVEIIRGIFGLFQDSEKEKKRLDPVYTEYYKSLDAQLYGYTRSNNYYKNKHGLTREQQDQQTALNQQIVVNVDGRNVMDQRINQVTDAQFNSQLEFNLAN